MPKPSFPSRFFRQRQSCLRFLRCESGAALVEFAITLPSMLLLFAVIIEGSRLMLSYQSAIAAVRDAARYMSRVVSADICESGGSVAGYSAQLLDIVRNSTSGESVFPSYVTVDFVTPTYTCVPGTYRIDEVLLRTMSKSCALSPPRCRRFRRCRQRPRATCNSSIRTALDKTTSADCPR